MPRRCRTIRKGAAFAAALSLSVLAAVSGTSPAGAAPTRLTSAESSFLAAINGPGRAADFQGR
jgi:hypothetical protein